MRSKWYWKRKKQMKIKVKMKGNISYRKYYLREILEFKVSNDIYYFVFLFKPGCCLQLEFLGVC